MTVSVETFEKVATLGEALKVQPRCHVGMLVIPNSPQQIPPKVGDKNTPPKRASTRAEKLKLYGLYKRATVESDQRPARPGMFNVDGRMKWDAWAAEDGLSKEEARQAYVELAKELVGKPVEDVLAAE